MIYARVRCLKTSRLMIWVVLCLVVVGLLIAPRWDVVNRNFNTDEAFTATYTAASNVPALIDEIRKNEETPPIYFLLLWVWSHVFGMSELALRGFSAVTGTLAVTLFGIFTFRRLPFTVAAMACFILLAFNVTTFYMVVARSYMLTLLCVMLCIITFEHVYNNFDRPSSYLLYGSCAALLVLTNYFGLAIIIGQQIVWLERWWHSPERRRSRFMWWIAAEAIVGGVLLLWLPILLYQLRIAPAVTISQGEDARLYIWMLLSIIVSISVSSAWLPVLGGVAALLWGLAIIGIVKSRSRYNGLIWRTFVTPLAGWVLLLGVTQAFAVRYSVVLLPSLALSIAVGWFTLYQQRRVIGSVVGILLVGGVLTNQILVRTTSVSATPWTNLQAVVAAHAQSTDDCVLFHAPWDQRIFEYYYVGQPLCLLGAHNYDDFYFTQDYSIKNSWTEQEAVAAVQHTRRVWVFDNYEYALPRLVLPYPVVDEWQDGALHLTLYAVHSARP